jgi:hypothetical protein
MKQDNSKHAGKPTLAELQTKLDGVRREVRNLTVWNLLSRAGVSFRRLKMSYMRSRDLSSPPTHRKKMFRG